MLQIGRSGQCGGRSASGEDDRSGRLKDRIAEGDRYSDDNEKSPIEVRLEVFRLG